MAIGIYKFILVIFAIWCLLKAWDEHDSGNRNDMAGVYMFGAVSVGLFFV